MLRICQLGSGSRGNALYLESANARILVDAGFSGAELGRRLRLIGAAPERLTALVITHEHVDHVRGAGVMSRKYRIPVFVTEATLNSMSDSAGALHETCLFRPGESFRIQDLQFRPFVCSHDAADPVNFSISCGKSRLGVATDLGHVTALVRSHLQHCQALIVETNHDPFLLRGSSYPPAVIQRISSRFGHLSNEQGAELVASVNHRDLKYLFLAHLSETNNHPEKAYRAVDLVLGGKGHRPEITLCTQDRPSSVISL